MNEYSYKKLMISCPWKALTRFFSMIYAKKNIRFLSRSCDKSGQKPGESLADSQWTNPSISISDESLQADRAGIYQPQKWVGRFCATGQLKSDRGWISTVLHHLWCTSQADSPQGQADYFEPDIQFVGWSNCWVVEAESLLPVISRQNF